MHKIHTRKDIRPNLFHKIRNYIKEYRILLSYICHFEYTQKCKDQLHVLQHLQNTSGKAMDAWSITKFLHNNNLNKKGLLTMYSIKARKTLQELQDNRWIYI